jgi:transcriptional regulator with XRE-family HTH domain
VQPSAGLPRLRAARIAAGWTQTQVATKLQYVARARSDAHALVNADMVSKWERGQKLPSPRYRALLCQLFGMTPEQLGFDPVASDPNSPRPARDPESLLTMLDNAAALLDQLGAAGNAIAPQLLAAWAETTKSHRTMLGLLDPAEPEHLSTATIEDYERLAKRYDELHATADPLALSQAVNAHVKAVTQALRGKHQPDERRRMLRNLAQVASLAGQLAHGRLNDAFTARAHYSIALDAACEAGDHRAAASTLKRAADLAHASGQPTAANTHTIAAALHAGDDHPPHHAA